MDNKINLRPATANDDDFLVQVYASTRPEVQAFGWDDSQQLAFIKMQYDMRSRWYSVQWPNADHTIVLFEGARAGRLMIDRSPERMSLVDIGIIPEFRRRGIATALMIGLKEEALTRMLSLELKVDKTNAPALDLYQKLGFEVAHESDLLFQMRWTPMRLYP